MTNERKNEALRRLKAALESDFPAAQLSDVIYDADLDGRYDADDLADALLPILIQSGWARRPSTKVASS